MFDRLFRRTPSSFQVQLQPEGRSVTATSDDSILQAFLREGLPFPHNCRVGGCGECKCKLVSGKVKELTDKSYLLSAEELQQGYILACQSRPRSDVVVEAQLRSAEAVAPAKATRGRIVARTALTPDILHVVMDLDTVMPYRAGQYAELLIPPEAGGREEAPEVRAFSFASAPDPTQPQRVDFFIRQVPGGRFTPWLFAHAPVGQSLQVQGPLGQFGLRGGEGPMVCVAGGSGLAPIIAMLQQLVADGQTQRALTVVFGARTQADLYGRQLIDGIRQHWRGAFRVVYALAHEPADSTWAGERGTASEALARELPAIHAWTQPAQAWLCGPPGMIDACVTVLAQAGMPAEHIHQDRFLDASMTSGITSQAA